MSFKRAGEGMFVGSVRESFMWKVSFELDFLKGGSMGGGGGIFGERSIVKIVRKS